MVYINDIFIKCSGDCIFEWSMGVIMIVIFVIFIIGRLINGRIKVFIEDILV